LFKQTNDQGPLVPCQPATNINEIETVPRFRNCVEGQVSPAVGTRFDYQGIWSRIATLRMRGGLRMAATSATLSGLPRWHRRVWKARMVDTVTV